MNCVARKKPIGLFELRQMSCEASSRWAINTIKSLGDSNGVWNTSKKDLMRLVIEYFKGLFSSNNPYFFMTLWRVLSSVWQMKWIKFSIKAQCGGNKSSNWFMLLTYAPRPDGMHALFYKEFWREFCSISPMWTLWRGLGGDKWNCVILTSQILPLF